MRDVNTAVASGKHEKHLLKSLQNAIRMGVCCVDRMEVYFYADSCLYLRRQKAAVMLAHLLHTITQKIVGILWSS